MPWLLRNGQVVLSLQGGLGNQLFEWAYAQALTEGGREVLFDHVRCRGARPLAVGPLIPPGRRLNRASGLALLLAVRLGLLSDTSRPRLVRQRVSGFDRSVPERLGGTSYLLGYFQSPHYFQGSSDSVRTAATALLRSMLSESGLALLKRLESDERSVAIHVRRGDYLSDPGAAERHGVLGRDYYDRALAQLEAVAPRNRVWFGDDPEWVRQNLARDGDLVCPADAATADGGEIALMAACASRVIANSSFSWWAGWLGRPSTAANPVIAPLVWFADGHSDAAELVPADWVRL